MIRHAAWAAGVVALMGCISGSPFAPSKPVFDTIPESDFRTLARNIEEAVAAGNREAEIAVPAGLTIDRDELKQAIRTRGARSELIDTLRDSGFGVEQSNGLIAVDRGGDYQRASTKRERDRNAMLVMGENNDRWALYEGLLKANDLPGRALGAIQAVFAQERRAFLDPAHRFEDAAAE